MKQKNTESVRSGENTVSERTSDSVERRTATEGNPGKSAAAASLKAGKVSTVLEWVRQVAKRDRYPNQRLIV